jgi:hypothetical protein
LFNIFISDIPQSPRTNIALFADDTTIYSESRNVEATTNNLQDHLNLLAKWCNSWKIHINASKSTAVIFSLRRYSTPPPLRFDNDSIPWQPSVKYLGVTIDKRLTWGPHIASKLQQAYQRLSMLFPILNKKSVTKIQNKLYEASSRNKQITLMWIPGHTGIPGNELADQQAKIATLNEEVPILPTPTYDDIKTLISQMSNDKWLRIWKHQTTKLNTIKRSTNRWANSSLKRKEEIVLNRMRISHTRITHGYLMGKEEAPICDVCGVRLTVKHILSECLKYEQDRQRIGIDTSLDTALGPETEDNIKMLDFLKSTNLFNSI